MLKNKENYIKTVFFILNGKQYKVRYFKKISLHHFLIFLGYKLNLIAVEYNGKIITRTQWKDIYLTNNINLEIVTIVGGG
uniref:thiamine biosynthesis protein S n=1 Tax=Chattonella marina TaxID=90936 RepID=UPI00211535C2|nr:thiamine biosynthesis protein S [Chattonella marina]UTE94880.1 thiamine biosynthesis protein S [Chattonella marina]